MSESQVDQTLNRLAYEVAERNRGAENVTVFGILRAGARIARMLARHLGSIDGISVPVYDLDIGAYRDDAARGAGSEPSDSATDASPEDSPDVTDRDVLLVDDVLFTGRTIRAALDAIVRFGRPRTIQLMVLVDRGHREYPIQPDYVGRVIVTRKTARVVVVSNIDNSSVFVED